MKRFILSLLSLSFALVLNANASGYLWKATAIEGILFQDGKFYGPYIEKLINGRYTTFNWLTNFAQGEEVYVYGEEYYGNMVWVEVHGMPHDEPTVKIGTKYGVIMKTDNLVNSSKIIYGKRYKFFVPKIPVTSVTSITDLDIKDTLRVYDGTSLKFEAGIK